VAQQLGEAAEAVVPLVEGRVLAQDRAVPVHGALVLVRASCHLLYSAFLMNLDMRKPSKILFIYIVIMVVIRSVHKCREPKVLYEGVILTWEIGKYIYSP
jgi:hypothetical protein